MSKLYLRRSPRIGNPVNFLKKQFIKKILFPVYLFPFKLVFYLIIFLVKGFFNFFFSLSLIAIDMIIYPFRGLRNFLKSLCIMAVAVYMAVSLFVIADYLRTQYGWYGKFFCSRDVQETVQGSVVRIVGGYSEGSGFFITPNQVITNFHVIADEPSPKIIFPSGKFVTPTKIVGYQEADLAILTTQEKYDNIVMPLPMAIELKRDEQVIAAGYALGTDLTGKATLLKGRFTDYRQSSKAPIDYLQSDISLVEGMSGGPLVDQCGKVVGINTQGLAGLSLFINASSARINLSRFTDQNITKIDVDPSASPEKAVEAFYTYLKARQMEKGFALLSEEYLKKTNLQEWTNRFTDILDVDVILTEPHENTDDTVFVKFTTTNWNGIDSEVHFFEGTWETVLEDDVYKMLKSNIQEVEEPEWEWFY